MAVLAGKMAKNRAFFIWIVSLGDYAHISYGLSMVSSRRTVLSKPIVSSSDISVASVEMEFPTVSPTGSEGEIATVPPFSQPSDSTAYKVNVQ
jgi:hypothetical protein